MNSWMLLEVFMGQSMNIYKWGLGVVWPKEVNSSTDTHSVFLHVENVKILKEYISQI